MSFLFIRVTHVAASSRINLIVVIIDHRVCGGGDNVLGRESLPVDGFVRLEAD